MLKASTKPLSNLLPIAQTYVKAIANISEALVNDDIL